MHQISWDSPWAKLINNHLDHCTALVADIVVNSMCKHIDNVINMLVRK